MNNRLYQNRLKKMGIALYKKVLYLLLGFCAGLVFFQASEASEAKANKILFLGDSYTVGTGIGEGHEQEAFPYQLINQLKAAKIAIAPPKIYAVDGDTTKHLLGALNASEPQSNPENANYSAGDYSLVVLSIGINDLFRGHSIEDYQYHFSELLSRAIHFADDDLSRVIVLSIPAWDASPSVFSGKGPEFRANKYAQVRKNINEISIPVEALKTDSHGQTTLLLDAKKLNEKRLNANRYNTEAGIAHDIDTFNQVALEIIKKRNAQHHQGQIHFIDLTELTRAGAKDKQGKPLSALFAEDGIHYTGKMYQQWAEVVYPLAKERLSRP